MTVGSRVAGVGGAVRVAHIAPVFPPYRGGMGTVAYHQAKALAAAGASITVLTPRSTTPRRRPPGVEVIELPPLFSRGNAACLPQVLSRAGHFDLLHLHYPFFGTAELPWTPLLPHWTPWIQASLVLAGQATGLSSGWLEMCALFGGERRALAAFAPTATLVTLAALVLLRLYAG